MSGITPGGDLAMGANSTRSGTVAIPALATQAGDSITVTFSEPLDDADYEVDFSVAGATTINFVVYDKTASGFKIYARNNANYGQNQFNLYYKAFKLYEVSEAEQNAEDIADIQSKIPATASSTNKLATSNQLSTLETSVDTRLDAVEDVIPSGATIQNQVITQSELNTALATKQNTLTFDNTPTAGSTNPVTSDGIKSALDDMDSDAFEAMSINGAKNHLPINLSHIRENNTGGTWSSNVYTYNGITWTFNNDGTVTANGTASATSLVYLIHRLERNYWVPVEAEYIVSGNPVDGTSEDWTTAIYYSDTTDGTNSKGQYGLAEITTTFVPNHYAWFTLYVNNGKTISNVVFKPMVRLAVDTDSVFQPYTMTNQQITPIAQSVSNPNLLDNPWFTVNQRGQSSYTANGYMVDRWKDDSLQGMTVQVNDNGITLNCTNLTSGTGIRQVFEYPDFLRGKTVTLSVLLSSGVVKSGTFTIPSTTPSSSTNIKYIYLNDAQTVYAYIRCQNNGNIYCDIYCNTSFTGSSISIRAIKLELGSASTLANDVAPNYATELLKCQRYFIRYASNGNYCTLALGTEYNSKINAPFYLPCVMRTSPTISFSGSVRTYYTTDNTKNSDVTVLANAGMVGNCIKLNATYGTSLGNGAVAEIQLFTDAYVDLSADL